MKDLVSIEDKGGCTDVGEEDLQWLLPVSGWCFRPELTDNDGEGGVQDEFARVRLEESDGW